MNIKTHFEFPPIPMRCFDWCAYDDNTSGDGEDQTLGWGATEQEAIDDLKEKLEDEEIYRESQTSPIPTSET